MRGNVGRRPAAAAAAPAHQGRSKSPFDKSHIHKSLTETRLRFALIVALSFAVLVGLYSSVVSAPASEDLAPTQVVTAIEHLHEDEIVDEEVDNHMSNGKSVGAYDEAEEDLETLHDSDEITEKPTLRQEIAISNENAEKEPQFEPSQPTEKVLSSRKTSRSRTSSSKTNVKEEEEEEDEDFEIPFDIRPVHRNGCPFGWHSPTPRSPVCYHVSLITLPADEANARCAEMGSLYGMRAYLARVSSIEVNAMLCDILNRGNNRFLHPDRLHLGLTDPMPGITDPNATLGWRDGKAFAQHFAPFVSDFPKSLKDKTVSLSCNGKNYLKWNVEPDSALPYACSGPKLAYAKSEDHDPKDRRELDEDTFLYEQSDLETADWSSVATWDSSVLAECKGLQGEEDERLAHKNVVLGRLETQITWPLTEYRKKTEPRRYYMVWQSKAWYGWLDFWVEYLVKYRAFHGAPVGKYVTVSRAAKERLGYSGIFANPELAMKYGGSLVVLSRLPIPDNVVSYFPTGTLVNQIYMDPLERVPLGDKLELAQYLTNFAESKSCHSVGDLKVIPDTFDLSTEKGCLKAIKVMEKSHDKTEIEWIIKGPKHGGAAIILASANMVIERLSPCSPEILARRELVQKLVTKPLLLDGRKFDIRVFVLVASTKPFIAYVHREPYYRATIRKFMTTGTASDKSRHVTNTHIQKVARYNFTDKDWADHLWTPDRVKLYATKAGVQTDFWSAVVFPKVKRAVHSVFRATTMSVKDRRQGQWKLFGVDFVIDENLHPYLLDWNAFPGWDWSYRLSWTLEYRRRILGDAWRLMLDIQRGQALAESRPTPKSGGFELIYHTVK